jgi:hypothetical protein
MCELFKILCRERNSNVDILANKFKYLGEVQIIEDTGDIPDTYRNLTEIKPITSWDKAFVNIEIRPTWFIEDDVYADSFDTLVNLVSAKNYELAAMYISSFVESPNWENWDRGEHFNKSWKSFNPICRLSDSLIKKIIDFKQLRNNFIFHEILFASLADTKLDMFKEYPELFGEFNWRPIISKPKCGRISHPVKYYIS